VNIAAGTTTLQLAATKGKKLENLLKSNLNGEYYDR
jgi:hypothetical protein